MAITRDTIAYPLTVIDLCVQFLGLSAAEVEEVLLTCPHSLPLRAFLRRLADKTLSHHLVTAPIRARLHALFELQALMAEESLIVQRGLINWCELTDFLVVTLDGRARETFMAVFFDGRYRLIASEILFVGSVDSACVYHRVILSRALAHEATSVVVAHNHPSGSLVPSQADIETTRALVRCLKLLDIALLDHVIVAAGRFESLKNLGLV